ncbi:hypothetical protein ACKI1J_14530 [Streptomyces scabiei]|uniref:hypothetical protein n=1 Tax=Streptomyces scabiei TaxID=1930 RepID=UPI0038F62B5E
MNALEIRYALKKALDANDDVYEVEMDSPVPGAPAQLTVFSLDGRKFTISVQEQ